MALERYIGVEDDELKDFIEEDGGKASDGIGEVDGPGRLVESERHPGRGETQEGDHQHPVSQPVEEIEPEVVLVLIRHGAIHSSSFVVLRLLTPPSPCPPTTG